MSEQKDTIYIDIDDEITSIIDKVASSKKKVVALVLPKRATVMQSIVNMRLLKRASDGAGKSIVLITSEAGVLPLAGTVGLYVAKTLQSKPFIPTSDLEITGDLDVPEEDSGDDAPIDETKTVGELSGATEEDAIEVDNDTKEEPGGEAIDLAAAKKPKKDKKLRIPNFDSFRKKLFLGLGLLLILLIGWYVAFFVMPKATITLKTDTTSTAVDLTLLASPAVDTLDEANKVVPSIVQESKKTNTQKVPTTGEKNLGEKAEGTVTMTTTTNCVSEVSSVPVGSIVSSGDLRFVTRQKANFAPSDVQDGKCIFTTDEIDVIAEAGGGQYNLSARNYAVANRSSVTAKGSNMSGGTDKIIKIVSQEDLNSAKTKALEQNTDAIKAEVAAALTQAEYIPITETFASSEPVVTSSPNVGAEANEVTVTVVTSHTMLGMKRDAVKKLIENEAKKQIDIDKQQISDDGVDDAIFQLFERKPDGETRLNLKTTVVTGLQLNAEELKKQVAGKRRGEIQQILNLPGVKDVEVDYSPFWVTKTTSKQDKITIVIENEGQ